MVQQQPSSNRVRSWGVLDSCPERDCPTVITSEQDFETVRDAIMDVWLADVEASNAVKDEAKAALSRIEAERVFLLNADYTKLLGQRDALQTALEELAEWSLPQMRLFAQRVLKKLEEK